MKKLLFIALIIVGVYYWENVKPYAVGTWNYFSKTEIGKTIIDNSKDINEEIDKVKE